MPRLSTLGRGMRRFRASGRAVRTTPSLDSGITGSTASQPTPFRNRTRSNVRRSRAWTQARGGRGLVLDRQLSAIEAAGVPKNTIKIDLLRDSPSGRLIQPDLYRSSPLNWSMLNLALAPPNCSGTNLQRLRVPTSAHGPVGGASSYLDALPAFLAAEQSIYLLRALWCVLALVGASSQLIDKLSLMRQWQGPLS